MAPIRIEEVPRLLPHAISLPPLCNCPDLRKSASPLCNSPELCNSFPFRSVIAPTSAIPNPGDIMAQGNNQSQKERKNEEGYEVDCVDVADTSNPNRVSHMKNKFAGLIFMCNSATKQDCFRYHVFGMPSAKMELVQKVHPGMKLFLFDSDLRLMYGIYKAASCGGNELEHNAFRGSKKSFPAQVRFRIDRDCRPLPEEIFNKAIKDNYVDGGNKFKFELSAEHVKNLSHLFRSVDSNVAREERHAHGGNLDLVVEREGRLLREAAARNIEESFRLFTREKAIRNRELERLRSEYVGNVDAGHVAYNPSAHSFQTYNPHPVVLEREMPGYGVERHLSRAPPPLEGRIRDPPGSFYDLLVPAAMSGRETIQYGVERNLVPLLSRDLLVDPLLESSGSVHGMRSLPPRNDLIDNLQYRSRNPQYDVYQQRTDVDIKQRSAPLDVYRERMEMDMRQHNPQFDIYQQRADVHRLQRIMDGAYPHEMKRP